MSNSFFSTSSLLLRNPCFAPLHPSKRVNCFSQYLFHAPSLAEIGIESDPRPVFRLALCVFAAVRIYTSADYQRSATVSSVGANQFDFFYFDRDSSMLSGCSTLAIIAMPSVSGDSGNPILHLSDRPFTSTGGCDSWATLCMISAAGYDMITMQSSQTTSTGYFYVAVMGYPAIAYTLMLDWFGSSGACSFGMHCMYLIELAHMKC